MSRDIHAAVVALSSLQKHFGRETISAEVGELSERLVARYLGAKRTVRNSRGHDLDMPNGDLVEVKGRVIGPYGESVLFSFGKHTQHAKSAFCSYGIWMSMANLRFTPLIVFRSNSSGKLGESQIKRNILREQIGEG